MNFEDMPWFDIVIRIAVLLLFVGALSTIVDRIDSLNKRIDDLLIERDGLVLAVNELRVLNGMEVVLEYERFGKNDYQ